MSHEVTKEEKALAFSLGEMSLNDIKNLVNQDVPAQRVLELLKQVESVTDNLTHGEVLGLALGLAMTSLLTMALPEENETSAPNPVS